MRPTSDHDRKATTERPHHPPMSTPVATIDPASTDTPRLAYSVDEAADMIGISRRSIYELLRSGQLRSVKIGARRLVRRSDLDTFLEELEPCR